MKKLMAIAAVLASLTTPAWAGTSRSTCGSGYITFLGVNASTLETGVKNKRNIYLSLDKLWPGTNNYGAVDGKVAIIINYYDDGMMESQLEALRTAFVAGVPVKVMAEKKDCTLYDQDFNVTMCPASAADGVCLIQ